MKEDLMNKFALWLQDAASKIETLATEQIPPLVTEFLQWRLCSNIFDASASGFFAVVWMVIIYKSYKITNHHYEEWKERMIKEDDDSDFVSYMKYENTAGPLIGAIISIVGFACILGHLVTMLVPLKEIIQINVAPKIYLIEEAAKLIKK